MPHEPGHNPFYSFQKGGTPQSIPSTSNLLPPPQPTTSIEQVAQAAPPRKGRGGFFDPLITKEAVQKGVKDSWLPDPIEKPVGQVLGTIAEYTSSPFDLAMVPTWAFGGPAISAGLKGARVLSKFPKGLKWFPKVLGSLFDPFPGTVTSLPLRLLAETGATAGGGFLGKEAAEYGEDLGGLPGAIVGGLAGGLVGGTAGGLGTVGIMKSIARLKGRSSLSPKDHAGLYSMMESDKFVPVRNTTEEDLKKKLKEVVQKETARQFEIAKQTGEEITVPGFGAIEVETDLPFWNKTVVGKRQLYYEPPQWIQENLPELVRPTIKDQLMPLLQKTDTASALNIRNISTEDRQDLQKEALKKIRKERQDLTDRLGRSGVMIVNPDGSTRQSFNRQDIQAEVIREKGTEDTDFKKAIEKAEEELKLNEQKARALLSQLYQDPHELEINTVDDLDNLIMPDVDTTKIVSDIEVATAETALSKLGRTVDKLPRPLSNVLGRVHRLGNPMSKARTLMEKLGAAKNIGEKNASIAAMKLYEWTGLWKMDEVFGKTNNNVWIKNEAGERVGNIMVGKLEDGGELKEAAKAAGIHDAENLSVLRILEETKPLENQWFTYKKGKIIDKARDYRKLLTDDQKEMLRRVALANEYSQKQLRKFGIRTNQNFTAKSELEQQDMFAWTQSMLDEAAEEMKLNPDISDAEKQLFDQDVNYANRRVIMHKKTNDIAIIGKEDRVWKLGKKIGAEYSRQFNRISSAEAEGYVYMPLDSAFIIGMTSKHKRALYQSMAKYLKESIEKGDYKEYKDIEVIRLEDRRNELLFRELQRERPGLTDKKVAELMARSMDGDLDARPDQVILAHNAKRVLPKIRIIRKKLEAGESIRGLVGEDLDVIKEIFTLYPARYFQENEIDISDLFDDKNGLKRLQGLKENNFENKNTNESFKEILEKLNLENEEEAEFVITLAWAKRIMGDNFVSNGGRIKDVNLDKIKEVIDGTRIGTKEDAQELRKLIDAYKDSVSETGRTRQAELQSQIDELGQMREAFDYEDERSFGLLSQMNELQARYDEINRLQFIYKRYGSNKRLDFIDEDFLTGLKYKKDGFDAEYNSNVFAKEQADLLNIEGVDELSIVQIEDQLNSYNEFIDGALIKSRQKINWDADPERLDKALGKLETRQYETLVGRTETFINKKGQKETRKIPGVEEIILNQEIRAKKNLDDVIFLDQPELDELIFRTAKDAEQGAHETLLKMRRDFDAIFEQVNPGEMSKWWTGVNAIQRMVALGFDASIFMIQLFPVMMNHPRIMPKVFKGYFNALLRTWRDPDAGKQMMLQYRNMPENQAILRKYGRWLLMSEDNEVFDLLATGKMGEVFQQQVQDPGRVGDVARAGQRFGGGFKNAFDHVLDIAGIEIAKAMDVVVDGATPEMIDKQVKAVADYANGMRGLFSSQAAGVSAVQRYKEAQWMLAARYRRAVASLYAMAFSDDPTRSLLAQKAMVNLATGTIMASIVLQMMGSYIDGDNEDETFDKVTNLIDPTSGGFLMFQAGGQSVGIGSKFVSDSKFIGKALTFMWKKGSGDDVKEWQDFLSMERTNPGLQWVRAQMAYAPTTAWGIFSGKDYIGEPVFRPGESNFDSITNFVQPLSEAAIPIWMSSTFFEGGGRDNDWAGQTLRGFSELYGMRTHPQSTSEILRLASYDYMDMPFDEMEPFQKDLLRHMLTDDLTKLQEEQVKQGANDFALYFNNIKRIEEEYQQGLIALTQLYPATKEGNRNMYTAYRGLKSGMRGQKTERGYDIEFEDESLKDSNPNKRALAQYWALYEKATIPGTQALDWDLWQNEYDKLMQTFTLEQQVTVARNSHDLPMPAVFMQRLAQIGKKEYRRIVIAQKLREDYWRSMGRDDLADKMRSYHLMLED